MTTLQIQFKFSAVFNIKTIVEYIDSLYKNKTFTRQSYLYDENTYNFIIKSSYRTVQHVTPILQYCSADIISQNALKE